MAIEVKTVVVSHTLNPKDGTVDFIQSLGAFSSYARAYGEAIIYLSEIADGRRGPGHVCTISTLQELEGKMGFSLYMKNLDGEITDVVYILEANAPEESDRGGGSNDPGED